MSKRNDSILKSFINGEYNKLVNYVRSYIGHSLLFYEPEDIIQDVALNIYSKLDLNAPVENLAGYFYRALKNKIIDLRRKPKHDQSIEDYRDEKEENYLLKTIPDENDDLLIEEKEERYRQLYEAIEMLKPDEQAIIYETELTGISFEELSKRWNIPIGTLLSRKHRAMQKVQKIVEKQNNHLN